MGEMYLLTSSVSGPSTCTGAAATIASHIVAAMKTTAPLIIADQGSPGHAYVITTNDSRWPDLTCMYGTGALTLANFYPVNVGQSATNILNSYQITTSSSGGTALGGNVTLGGSVVIQ
jgi:hypothetical protein